MTVQLIVFLILALVIVGCSIMAVTTKRMMRAATHLLFVLFATAGIYFLLGYTFLGSVQLAVYAGGITVLLVFAVLLTSSQDNREHMSWGGKAVAGGIAALSGLVIALFLILKNEFKASVLTSGETPMVAIGKTMMGTEKYQYVLPFEVISILLLACIVGGILIARKE